MKREIKFRAKQKLNGPFVYGDVYNNRDIGANMYFIVNDDDNYGFAQEFQVIPHTLGQFTGFKDNKGNEIYEGDILGDWNEVDGKMVQSKMQVFWYGEVGAWKLDNSFNQDKSSGDLLSNEIADFKYEIVGNIHDQVKAQ